MASVGNNTSGKIAHVRDSYFDSGEKEYLEELLKNPKEMELHQKLLKVNAEKLYAKAQQLMVAVESGEFNEKQMAEAEYQITHLLAAIEDLEKVLILEKTRDSAESKPKDSISMKILARYDNKGKHEEEHKEDFGLTI